MTYDIRRFAEYTGQMPGDSTYEVENLEQLWVYCRGNSTQLQHLVGYLPFELQDDVLRARCRRLLDRPRLDGCECAAACRLRGADGWHVPLRVRGPARVGCHGPGVLGLPQGVRPRGHAARQTTVSRLASRTTTSTCSASRRHSTTASTTRRGATSVCIPQFQVRAVPEKNGSGFDSFDVVSRDPSVDYVAKSRRTGTADVSIGRIDIANGILGGEPLRGRNSARCRAARRRLQVDRSQRRAARRQELPVELHPAHPHTPPRLGDIRARPDPQFHRHRGVSRRNACHRLLRLSKNERAFRLHDRGAEPAAVGCGAQCRRIRLVGLDHDGCSGRALRDGAARSVDLHRSCCRPLRQLEADRTETSCVHRGVEGLDHAAVVLREPHT